MNARPDIPEIVEEKPLPVRSWRSRRRLLVLFTILFCVIPALGVFLALPSSEERRLAEEQAQAKASVGRPLMPRLPGSPDDAELDQTPADKLSSEEAIKFNASVPESDAQIFPARPFTIPMSAAMQFSRQTAINCLTSAIYYEAAIEAEQGQRAVAQVVLNRVRHPAYPNNVCGVVFQGSERTTGCQFTFTCDGSLARKPNKAIWQRAKQYASDALSGKVEPSVGTATHYHTVWIVPYWAKSLEKVKTIGSHIFYRWSGYWGKPGAFAEQYAGEDLDENSAEEAIENAALELDDSFDGLEEEVTYEPPPDPILAPKFTVDAPEAPLPDTGIIAADKGNGDLAADRNSGTLILD